MKKEQKEQDYKTLINEILEKIENQEVLVKIYTVVKTHFEILKEKEREG